MNLKGGATIPAGAGVVVPVQLVQMDDYNWGSDAGEFNPYRFLAKSREGSDILLNKSFSGFHSYPFRCCVYGFHVSYSTFSVMPVLTNHTFPFPFSLRMQQQYMAFTLLYHLPLPIFYAILLHDSLILYSMNILV